MSYTPPKRPETIPPDHVWVAVEKLHHGDKFGPGALTWCQLRKGRHPTEGHAIDAAYDWWLETDQSDSHCDVTFSVQRPDGTLVAHRVVIGMQLVSRAWTRTDGAEESAA